MANPGIARKIGLRNIETRKSTPVVKAVNPVFPPTPTPALDSTKLDMVDVPRQAPAVVPRASDKRTLPALGSSPLSSRRSALSAMPTTVPIVSNKSTNRKLNKIAIKESKWLAAQEKLN